MHVCEMHLYDGHQMAFKKERNYIKISFPGAPCKLTSAIEIYKENSNH